MPETSPRWMRHLVYRSERTRASWTLRIALLILAISAFWLTSGWWTTSIGRGLVCDAGYAPSEAILIDNFDPDYLLFERARDLRRAGVAPRVFVPIYVDEPGAKPNAVALGIAQVMARISGVGPIDIIPVHHVEPITLNAAKDVTRFLGREGIGSIVVVTPLFRSRRAALVYDATVARTGIRVHCDPVRGSRGIDTWTRTWHGVQDVLQQWIKLQYYRLAIMPFA